ncbi:MAG TPA: hypothetical protein PKI11_07620 [Candidatus Hydrogenedentes bacterium]|nr:hypothetical protein [Candidatus Hydrogenedentota bacterium]HNT89216.1 hypothetical protein [Candidatus Hydrogenedentota bacterium]
MKRFRVVTYLVLLSSGVALSVTYWQGLEPRRELNVQTKEQVESRQRDLERLRDMVDKAEARVQCLESDPFALEVEIRGTGKFLKPGEKAYQIKVAPEGDASEQHFAEPVSSGPKSEAATPGNMSPDAETGAQPIEAPLTPGP